MKLRIGSRASRLAVLQSQWVMNRIRLTCPDIELELVTMKTTGDRILDRTLDQIGGKGLFVKELDQALLEGRVDLTVHSLKDLPMNLHPDLPIAAYTKREDPRDVLVLPTGASKLNRNRPIGCASQRRTVQLKSLFPDMAVKPVRGNIQTRLEKLDSGEYSALVLAAAGLNRLGLAERISRYFSVEEILPAAGQGILAVQSRGNMDPAILCSVQDKSAACCAESERAFVRALDGGCTSPTAAYAVIDNGQLTLNGLYLDDQKAKKRTGNISGSPEAGESLGIALAERMRRNAQ